MKTLAKPHHCHATGCTIPVHPTKLMCLAHWNQVPVNLKDQIFKHYRQSQCDDKRPSHDWVTAAMAAVAHVARLEGRVK